MILATALAAPNTADELQNQWRSLQFLRADPTRYRLVTEPFTISDGPLELTIDSGLLVPVFSGHTPNDHRARGQVKLEAWADDGVMPDPEQRGTVDFVGFVWVAGDGHFEVGWTERADHQTFANHMVRNLGNEREDFEGVARGEPWTGGATEGLILSIDEHVEDLFLGPDDQGHDPLEIVVYGEKSRPGALARAKWLLESRSALLERNGIDAGLWIAQDRLAVSRGRRELAAHAVIDLHVDRNLGQVGAARDDQPFDADWMTLVRDETGVMDTRRHTGLWVVDQGARGNIAWRITGVPFPFTEGDPLAPPTAPSRIVAEDAYVMVHAFDLAAEVGVEIVARLQLRAVGETVDHFELHIPRAGRKSSFKVLSATRDDGASLLAETPLVAHDPVLRPGGPDDDDAGPAEPPDPAGPPDPGRTRPPKPLPVDPYHERPESRITLVPPEPLQPGEALIVDVQWKDRWPLAGYQIHDVQGANGSGSTVINLGAGSGRQSVLPRLPGSPEGNPSKFRVRIYAQKRKYLREASSGTWLSTEDTDTHVITESGQVYRRVPFVEVAVGPYQIHDEGAPGYPNVRTRMYWKGEGQEMAAETRRLIKFYEGYLPKYPWPEHEVMQVPAWINGYVWVAAHEMTATMKAQVTSIEVGTRLAVESGRQTGQRIFAHEIAHQWWGHHVQPAHSDDFWFAETFAESMAQMYMGAVHGSYDVSMDRKREHWERWEDLHIPRASLTDAYRYSPTQPDVVYRYGPYVFQEMLRPRLGQVAYHGALDLLQRDFAYQAITTERIQDYFERASERDLDAFFDFWVHGGFVPEQVELAWEHRDGQVVGVVTSDVPFGTFDVPVSIDGDLVWVEVVDGRGELVHPSAERPSLIDLDPEHRILAGKRVCREGPARTD